MPNLSQIIDVRPLLRQGLDPLETVIARARGVVSHGSLTIEAPFDPLPLRRVLAQMGFSSDAVPVEEKYWRIHLLRDGLGILHGEPGEDACPGVPDPGAPVKREPDGVHIDVRGLAAPLPMLAILRLVSAIDPNERIVVHHDRDPVFLYPELAELGWGAETIPGDPGEVRLAITREH